MHTCQPPHTYNIFKSICSPNKIEVSSYRDVMTALSTYSKPKCNIIADRFKLYERSQGQIELLARIYNWTSTTVTCEPNNFLDTRLEETDLYMESVQSKLLNESDLTFKKVVETTVNMEMTQIELKVMTPENKYEINTGIQSKYWCSKFKRTNPIQFGILTMALITL